MCTCAKETSASGTFNGNVSCSNVLESSIQIGRKKGGENSNLLTTYNYGPGSGSFSVVLLEEGENAEHF